MNDEPLTFHFETARTTGLAFQIHDDSDTDEARLTTTRPQDRDVLVTIAARCSLDKMRAAKSVMLRIPALFADLAVLAREDERLRVLLGHYQVEVTHGEKTLWPLPVEPKT